MRSQNLTLRPPTLRQLQAETAEETSIIGTKGRIKVFSPSHSPTKIEVTTKHGGRGKLQVLSPLDGLRRPYLSPAQFVKKAIVAQKMRQELLRCFYDLDCLSFSSVCHDRETELRLCSRPHPPRWDQDSISRSQYVAVKDWFSSQRRQSDP